MTLAFEYYDQIAAGQKCYEFRAATNNWANRIKGCTEIKCIRGFLSAYSDCFGQCDSCEIVVHFLSPSILGYTAVNLTRPILSITQMSRADAETIGCPKDPNNKLFPAGCDEVFAIHFPAFAEPEVPKAQICQRGALRYCCIPFQCVFYFFCLETAVDTAPELPGHVYNTNYIDIYIYI